MPGLWGQKLRAKRTVRAGLCRAFNISQRSGLLATLGVATILMIGGESRSKPAIALQTQSASWQAGSFPVEDFVAYTSPFGYRQHPYGGYRFHYGLDIAAPSGSYIRAWWGGQVVEVTDDTACGTSLVIESEQWLHIYCHMQGHRVIEADGDRWFVDSAGGLKIRQGDWVEAGQPIGRVGLTGRTTGPHLHWGLKYQGAWVDPARILQAMVVAQEQAAVGN